jgi:phenylacetic acid degradation protein paaN
MSAFFAKHQELLTAAISATQARGFWSGYSENARAYGESSAAEGQAEFDALLGRFFDLGQPEDGPRIPGELSPYGLNLGVSYANANPTTLIAAAQKSQNAWGAASVTTRVGVALEILARLNRASFVMAHAVQHTTGQAFGMAFQAGGAHAQDRGLEAVAYAYQELSRVPEQVQWEKPAGRNMIRLVKEFHVAPVGIGLIIGCATFPTWNSYPALFADLVTGNAVIVKPHPGAILPLALTVKIGREVLAEAGFDPNVLLLAADTAEAPLTKSLALHTSIGLVDFTGSSTFGSWLRHNLPGKLLFTEEAGVNTIVIDGTNSFQPMCQNIAFSLSLYSGQMCTAPQTIFIPRDGIATNEGHKTFDEVAAGITGAVDALLAEPARAAGILGAIQNPATLTRIAQARSLGRVVRESAALPVANMRSATPLILALDNAESGAGYDECFGPISFLVPTNNTAESIQRATAVARDKGAITASLYTTDDAVIAAAMPAYVQAGVALSINLIGGIYVNQSAAFSDYHVSGANPAGNACLTDSAFIAGRFRVVGVRRLAAA